MENNIQGKTVIITGAGSGIGKAIAVRMGNLGCNVMLLGGRTESKLQAVAKEINSDGGKCIYFSGDLNDNSVRENGIAKANKEYGKIDILINNAGSAMNAVFTDVTEAQYDEIMNLDVKAPYFLTQKALPYLKESNYAMIINIASSLAHLGYPNQSVYAAAKHALLGWSKSIANEVYKDDIRVHIISPGGVFTEMVKLTRPDLTGDNMIVPEDIADTVEFLIKNRGNAVIDEIILHRVNKEPFTI